MRLHMFVNLASRCSFYMIVIALHDALFGYNDINSKLGIKSFPSSFCQYGNSLFNIRKSNPTRANIIERCKMSLFLVNEEELIYRSFR